MKKRYKILSVILALAIVLGSIVTISIVSSSASETFTDDNGIEWTVTDNYPAWSIKPTNVSSISGNVTIPATYNGKVVVAIDDKAFYNCTNLTSVIIPDGISHIGVRAFQGCSNLSNVDLSNSVTAIKENTFYLCTSLTSIDIPDSVTKLETGAFSSSGLTSISLSENIKEIGGNAFSGCTGLTSVSIPESIKVVKGFYDCSNLRSVTIPEGVEEIAGESFKNCTSLTTINLPNSIKIIGDQAFSGCSKLTSIVFPENLTKLGVGAFSSTGIKGELIIPNSVIEIGSGAFSRCQNITKAILPENITTINSTFYNCSNLTSVNLPSNLTSIIGRAFEATALSGKITIPDGVKSISAYAFQNCKNITSVEIPDSVTNIGTKAFYGCTRLTSVIGANNIKELGLNAFPSSLGVKCSATYTTFTDEYGVNWTIEEFNGIASIKPTTPTSISGNIIVPSSYNDISISEIKYAAFQNCTNITSVLISPGITNIDNSAFDGCTGLTSVSIPDSVSRIGNQAFYGCTNLSGELVIPNSVTEIGSSAFNKCTGITSVQLPNNITTVTGFSQCTNLKSVSIPDSVTIIDDFAFSSCSNLTSVVLPKNLQKIKTSAFSECRNLSGELIIPNSVTEIGRYAFDKCSNITGTLTIPDSVTIIGDSSFQLCYGITKLVLPNNIDTIGAHAFQNCVGLTDDLIIPNTVSNIDDYAFSGCENLNSITVPDSVTSIGIGAFRYCSKAFDSITIGKNVEYVGDFAYADLGLLDTLTVENKQLSDISTVAFYNDTFKNIEVANTVEKIDTALLSGNKNIASVGLGANVTISNPYAFYGNENMTIQTTTNSNSVIDYANKNNIPYEFVNLADVDKKVTFEVTCDKPGYEFTVYRVADLEKGSNPYYIRYDSLITDIEDEIFEGDSTALLEELDKVDANSLTEVIGTYSTDVDGSSKLFEDLPAGIYYVRATNFPANVYSVQNSVFALPYYTEENGWIYEITPIPLATKVDESNPEIVKTITNSTKDNVNFTDVSLGDTVNFEIEASRVGSANVVESKNFKLNSYVVSDIMESGLTLNQDSFVVTLEDIDGNTLTTLENTTDYVVNIVANEGADTTFTVALTPEYLAQDEFYSSANVVIAYSAVLNKYSTREFDGNYNTATDLTYSNKTNVTSTVEGNTVYAYTFGIEVNKYDDAGTPLAGSEFGLYLTEDDAKAMQNAIATGTSTDTGKVEFFTESNDVIRLASGTYYIVETKATENYNRYTDVIPVTITAEYSDTETNGTYLLSAPENGIQLVEVKNSKVVIPNTGGDGAMYRYLIALAFAMLAVTLVVIKKRSTKKATATK